MNTRICKRTHIYAEHTQIHTRAHAHTHTHTQCKRTRTRTCTDEEDDDIPKRFRRHMERRSNLGKPPKGHPGTSRFPYIRWDLREKKWRGELCLEGSEVSRVNKTFGFSSSSEEGAAKLWDKLARVARDEYGLKGTGTDFSEREMNFSPDGREHHACVLSRRHTHTRGRMRDRTHAPRHTHTHAHR